MPLSLSQIVWEIYRTSYMSLKFIKTGLKYNSGELLSNAIILFQNKPEPSLNHKPVSEHLTDFVEKKSFTGGGG